MRVNTSADDTENYDPFAETVVLPAPGVPAPSATPLSMPFEIVGEAPPDPDQGDGRG